MNTAKSLPVALSVLDTAKSLSIGKTSVYALIRGSQLETFCIGRKRLVTVASIESLIAQRCDSARLHSDNDNSN